MAYCLSFIIQTLNKIHPNKQIIDYLNEQNKTKPKQKTKYLYEYNLKNNTFKPQPS